jgi:predicted nucleic acid-binding Zn ribbon protein
VGVIFKGSGFHVTDYRKPEEKAKAESEAKVAEPAKRKTTTKSDD